MKGGNHYFKAGKVHKGKTHKMPNGKLHSGASHGKNSKPLFHYGELSKKSKDKARKHWGK